MKVIKRLMQCMLIGLLLFTSFTTTTKVEAEGEASSTWESIEDIDAAVSSGKSVAITMTTNKSDGTTPTYALPAAKFTSGAPNAVVATKDVNGVLTISGTEADYGWTITPVEGEDGYTITNNEGDYLYVISNNKGVRVSNKPDKGYVWSITDDYLAAADPDGKIRYLGVYNNADWRCYKRGDTTGEFPSNIADQTLEFWTIKESTGPEPEPIIAQLDKFTTAPENDSQLIIYYPEDSVALTTTANGSKLAGVAATVENGKLNQTASMAYLTVVLDTNGYYSFKDAEGNYLTSGATGSSLSFTTEANNYSLWTLQQQSDGTWFVPNANAVYNGESQQYLEYYSGFTTYGYSENSSNQYKFEFYGVHGSGGPVIPHVESITVSPTEKELEVGDTVQLEVTVSPSTATNQAVTYTGYDSSVISVSETGLVTALAEGTTAITITSVDTPSATATCTITVVTSTAVQKDYGLVSSLATGDKVIIYNKGNDRAVDNAFTNNKLVGADVDPVEGVITTDNEDIVWDVTVNSDGTVTFTQDDLTFGGNSSKKLAFTNVAYANWTLYGPDRNDFVYYLSLPEMQSNYGPYHLEYYKGEFKLYGTNDAPADKNAYGVQFYKEDADPETPQTVLVESITVDPSEVTLEIGDTQQLTVEVSPWDAANKAVTYAAADDTVVSVSDTGLVTALAEGTTSVIISAKDESGKTATCVVTVNPATVPLKNYGLASTLDTGDKIIIFNDASDKALGNTVDNYNLAAISVAPVNGVITTSNEDIVWTVTKNDDGTYGFTQNDYVLGGVKSGTHYNLVCTEATDTNWTLNGPENDFTYYLSLDDMEADEGKTVWMELHSNVFKIYPTDINPSGPDNKPLFGMTFYKEDHEPETPVTDILVESVTLNKTELELTILGSETLQATVLPEDATNRNVTWSSSDMT
ncbi:MAG: Ig-like domain-containing protein, partial [Erysipelotrichaceae bacterium]|nr:Ig-like domain-containing protein [Erysipelotrichaceae bacterium]